LKTVSDRYLLRHPKTRKIIERPQWLFMRVALGLSHNVEEAVEFYSIISQFLYMPSTPTLFNSGTLHPQMSSCYLLTVGEDSLDGIYKSITDCARLSKFSGGIGIDWTPVRASGSLIKGTNGLSNGIVPFLKVFDSSVHAVNQGGKRKGAAAVYLEPWHADIEAFLDLGPEWEARYEAAEKAGKAYKKVLARQLYARMMQTLAETGNGWMCFKDKSNLRSAQTAKPGNVIHSSNLCTEILEVTSKDETAVCNLGSVNLSSYVRPDGQFDYDLLRKVVKVATKFLDRVIDINFYPTSEAKHSNNKWRPVGLGIMGLQDAFFKMKLPFTSAKAKETSARIQETIYYQAINTSMELAKEHGSFTEFENSRYAEGKLQVQLAEGVQSTMPELHFDWDALAKEVQKNGLRNSLLISIAPTATIASIVGSYESIEPQISNFFKRETLSGEFLQVNRYLINELKGRGLWTDYIRGKIISADGSIQNIDEIPQEIRDLYRTVWETPQKDLIEMAVERSAFICQSQSLNLFMESPSIGKLSSMYMYAWKQGVKTTYYLRSRAKTSIQKTTVISGAEDTQPTATTTGANASATKATATAATPGSVTTASGTTYTAEEAIVCSLENPESCEACT
ncbi:MAG: ribonucleoside-diphosphate reductase subunit alpha, partial [Proteobacteria bacterium]